MRRFAAIILIFAFISSGCMVRFPSSSPGVTVSAVTAIPTATATPSPTNTPTPSPTNTPTPTATSTPSPTNTSTPTPTFTPTPAVTSTPSPIPTVTPRPTTVATLYCDYMTTMFAEASTGSSSVRKLACGDALTLVATLDGWSQVTDADGNNGYVMSRYFQNYPLVTLADAPASAIPATGYSFSEIIYFGDSRFMEIHHQIGYEKGIQISNTGYDFMMENLDNIKALYTDENSVIVIEFGVNDLQNVSKYAEAANALAAEGYNIAFMTVMPVNETLEAIWGYTIKNSSIDSFNTKLRSLLSDSIILLDANSYLTHTGYDLYDGLHYTYYTYQIIYQFINISLTGKCVWY